MGIHKRSIPGLMPTYHMYNDVYAWVSSGVYDKQTIIRDLSTNWGMSTEQARSLVALCISNIEQEE